MKVKEQVKALYLELNSAQRKRNRQQTKLKRLLGKCLFSGNPTLFAGCKAVVGSAGAKRLAT